MKALMSAGMAFVGGACLRLCYGSDGYDEGIGFRATVLSGTRGGIPRVRLTPWSLRHEAIFDI